MPSLDDILAQSKSESFRRLNTPGAVPPAPAAPVPLVAVAHLTITPSKDESKLNKTERAYLAHLRAERPPWIGVQSITLKLADDTRYTCDFFLLDDNGTLHGREVKGFFRDDAKVKIKVAARMFPFIRFHVVTKTKNGWQHIPISP